MFKAGCSPCDPVGTRRIKSTRRAIGCGDYIVPLTLIEPSWIPAEIVSISAFSSAET
jgi:hypothetical protein